MISNFKKQSRWSSLAALLVAVLAVATLTNAKSSTSALYVAKALSRADNPNGTDTTTAPPTNSDSSSTDSEEGSKDTATKVQDARLLIELGKLDKAEALLRKALKADPSHQGAAYYLSFIDKAKNEVPVQIKQPALPSPNPFTQLNSVSTPTGDPPRLVTRLFRVDPHSFAASLNHLTPAATNETVTATEKARAFFESAGIDFAGATSTEDQGRKSLLFNDQTGLIFVRGSQDDLKTIEQIVQLLNIKPPQVNIQTKLVEIGQTESKLLGFDWILGSEAPPSSNGVLGANRAATGILTGPQYQTVIRSMERSGAINVLLAPSIITLSGRQGRIEVGDLGFSLDALPTVSADGFTVQTTLSFELTEPLGTSETSLEPKQKQTIKVSTTTVAWDGQTIVLGGFPKEKTILRNGEQVTEKVIRLLFVTPTIVDPAGNRVHTDAGESYDPTVERLPVKP